MARALLAGEDAQVGHLRGQAGRGDLADVAPDKCGMRDRMERLGRKEARPNAVRAACGFLFEIERCFFPGRFPV